MQVPLTGGAYQNRSLIAAAQRCLNLYPEKNPEGSPFPFTYYPTPGLDLLFGTGDGPGRACYTCSTGQLLLVKGATVYAVDEAFSPTSLGSIDGAPTPVSISDNGTIAVIVDGSSEGYWIDLATLVMTPISAANFLGGTTVDYLDGYFLFNRPGTNQFYWSPPFWDGVIDFDPLDIASKSGSPDKIVAVQVCRREVWLFGEITTEVWQLTGAADSIFERIPGVFVEQGLVAAFSLCRQDLQQFWLHRDRQGHGMILMADSNYSAQRISTHAIENEIMSYGDISDAVAFTYQQEGHTFYQLTFPAADKTWVYDAATSEWHERAWMDIFDNVLHRHRASFGSFAYRANVVLDWQNGSVYAFNLNTYKDNNNPIRRIRGFPHMINDAVRVTYRRFILAMQVGDGSNDGLTETITTEIILGAGYNLGMGADFMIGVDDLTVLEVGLESVTVPVAPVVYLRWSDTAGYTWGNPRALSLGIAGAYLTSVQETRLGMARDRVFEVWWDAPVRTALNGSWVDTLSSAT